MDLLGSRTLNGTVTTGRRVLVVDGDPGVRRVLCSRLEREGFEVRQSDSAEALHELVPEVRPDLVLVDLEPGEALMPLELLRSTSDVPAIVLLRDGLAFDHVDALEAGADDYVTKPFSPRELMAKVRVTLRRTSRQPSDDRLEFDELVIDRRTRQVEVAGALVAMPAREFDLLFYLASSPRRVFSRSQLLENVWSSSDAWLGPATVTEHIRRLRQRIEVDPKHPRWVVTVWSVGYRFEP